MQRTTRSINGRNSISNIGVLARIFYIYVRRNALRLVFYIDIMDINDELLAIFSNWASLFDAIV